MISEFNITIKSGDGCPRLFMPTLYVVVLGVNRIGKGYFNSTNKSVEVTLRVRGGKAVKATMSSARLKVTAHGKKRFVVALK